MSLETPLTTSIKARLKNKAREQGRPFNDILQFYIIERFLYRLAQSAYAERFVLKGALVLIALDVPSLRPTRDIDLLGQTKNDLQHIADIFRQICLLQLPVADGVWFDSDSISISPIAENTKYSGARIRLMAYLGKARIPIQIDIGFGDALTSAPQQIRYPCLLTDLPAPQIRGYPVETIIAEKVQTMVALGWLNSRLKDFYDVWVLLENIPPSPAVLRDALERTFNYRGTPIPTTIPVAWTEDFAREKQMAWQAFLSRNGLNAPPLVEVVQRLQALLLPHFRVLTRE